MAKPVHTKFSKRLKIVYTSLALTAMMALVLLGGVGWWSLPIVIVAAYVAVIYSLDLDLKAEEWLVLPLYGVLAGVSFYTWVSQYGLEQGMTWFIVLIIIFGLSQYGLLLTLNILNIATIRVLPLARTAKTVLSLVGVVTAFSLFQLAVIVQPSLVNWALAVGGISFLVAWPLVWTSLAGQTRLIRSVGWSVLASLVMTQLGALVGWWPISYMSSLFLAIMLYIVLGVIHLQEQKLVNASELKQYIYLSLAITVGYYLASQW